MRMSVRAVVCALVALSGVSVTLAYPSWPSEAGLDFWHYGEMKDRLAAAEAERAELDADGLLVLDRIVTKDRLIASLHRGERTFASVVDEFAVLNRADPSSAAHVRAAYPGSTERASTARQVLSFVRQHYGGRPPTRLRQEARRLIAAESRGRAG